MTTRSLLIATRLIRKPIFWVVFLFCVFGFVLWNGEEEKKRDESTSLKKEAAEKKMLNKLADALIDASCDKNKNFKSLVWKENAGLQYAALNYDKIYMLAEKRNKMNCQYLVI